MVKATSNVEVVVQDFVRLLAPRIHATAVYEWEHYTSQGDVGLDLIVISPDFESLDVVQRSSAFVDAIVAMNAGIQAWGFTPGELSGNPYNGFLEMLMQEAHQVYPAPAAKPARKRKAGHVH